MCRSVGEDFVILAPSSAGRPLARTRDERRRRAPGHARSRRAPSPRSARHAVRRARRLVRRREARTPSPARPAPARRRSCTCWPGSTCRMRGACSSTASLWARSTARACGAAPHEPCVRWPGVSARPVPRRARERRAALAVARRRPAARPRSGRPRRSPAVGLEEHAERPVELALGGPAAARRARTRRSRCPPARRLPTSRRPASTPPMRCARRALRWSSRRDRRNDRRLRDARPAADRAGRPRALARIELMASQYRDDPGQRRPLRALRRPAGRHAARARGARGGEREPDGPGRALVGRRMTTRDALVETLARGGFRESPLLPSGNRPARKGVSWPVGPIARVARWASPRQPIPKARPAGASQRSA